MKTLLYNSKIASTVFLLFTLFFVGNAFGQITVVNSQTNSNAGPATLAINRPTSLQIGDLMIAHVTNRGTASDPTTVPSGWTKVTSYLVNSAGRYAYIAYKVATTSDITETSYTFGWGTTAQTDIAGAITAFRGVNTATSGGIGVTGTSATAQTANIAPPSITTLSNNAMVLFLANLSSVNFAAGNWTLGVSNTMTEAYQVDAGTAAGGLAYFTLSSAGVTGVGSKACVSGRWAANLLALTPAKFFRSKATGNWNALATWEESVDNSTWVNASSIPNSGDISVLIQNSHTVTLTATETAPSLTINANCVLALSTFGLTASSVSMEGGALTSGSSITGSGTLTLGGNITVTDNGGGTAGATISCPVALGANRTFTVADDGSAATDLNISGIISGAFTLDKAGAGKMVLSGANSYTGQTNVAAGVLNIQHATGVGTTAAGTVVSSGAALELEGGITVGAEALTINNTGISGGGSLRNISGNNTWGGTVTLSTNSARINSDAGTLTLSAAASVASTNIALTLGGAGDISVSGTTNIGSGTITKDGVGTVTLSGSSSYTGATTVSAGTLRLGATGTSPNSPLGTTGGATTVNSGAVLDLNGRTLAISEGLTINGTGISSGGALINSTGSNTWSGTLALGSDASVGGAGNITISGQISGSSVFTKIGAGTLTITTSDNSATFTGSWVIAEGAINTASYGLRMGNRGLTLGSASTSGRFIYDSSGAGGALSPASLTVAAGGGTINNNNTNNISFSVGITLNGTLTYDCSASSASNLTLSGKLTGTGGLTVNSTQAAAVLILQNSGNDYSGSTTITKGELRLNPSANATFASKIILNGGTLGTTGITSPRTFTSSSTLLVQENSTIALAASTSHSITFASSTLELWTESKIITVSNWATTAGSAGTSGRIFFSNNSGLSQTQLDAFTFSGYANTGAIFVSGGSSGEITPVNSVTYTSVATGIWSNSSTWSPTGVPTSIDNVIISSGHTISVTENAACKSVTFAAGTNGNLAVNSTVLLSVSGAIILNSSASANTDCTISGSGEIRCGSITVGSDVSPTGTNVVYSNIMTSTINTLTIQGAGNLTLRADNASSAYVNPRFYLNSGTLTVPGAIANSGVLSNASSGIRFWMDQGTANGTLILSGSSPWATCANCTTGGGLALYSRVLNGTSATVNYAGAAQTVFNTSYTNLTLSGSGAKTLAAFTVSGKLSMQGTATASTTALSSVGTLEYKGSGAQTASTIEWPATVTNLIIDNSAGVTLPATFTRTLSGDLTLTAGTLADGGNTLTVQGNIAGTGTHSGSGIITMTGASKTISGVTLGNLTLNNASGFSLSGSPTINGTLTLTSGIVTTSSNTLTMGAAGTISGASSSSYINGKLARVITGTNAMSFPVGKGGNYRPATFTYSTAPGTRTVTIERFDSGSPLSVPTASTARFGTGSWWILQSDTGVSYTVSLNNGGVTPSGTAVMLRREGGSEATQHPVSFSSPNYTNTSAFNTTVASNDVMLAESSIPLTITGVTASNKTYDGNTTATLNTGSAALSGVVGSDAVTLSIASATGTFDNKNAGTGKTVTTSGFSLTGANAGAYSLTQPSTTANITAKGLTAALTGTVSKTYDGDSTATLTTSNYTLTGVVDSENVTVTNTVGAYDTKNVGTGKTITVSSPLTLGGTDAGNYTISGNATGAVGTIIAKGLTAALTGTITKTYDGNTTATLTTANYSLTGVVGSETVTVTNTGGTYDTKNVGTSKSVTVSAPLTLGGADAGNYSISGNATGSVGTITAINLSVTGLTGANKVYDGNTTASANGTAALSGVINGENVTLSGTPVFTFASANVANGISISTTGYTLGGTDNGNYTLTQPTLSANITASSLTVTASAQSKTYGATAPTSGTLNTNFTVSGLVGGDVVSGATLSYSGTPAGNTANAGVGSYTITPSALTLSSGLTSNYSITYTTGTLTVNTASLTVTASAQSKTYGATAPTSGTLNTNFTVSGLVSGDVISGATLSYSGSPAGNLATATPGSYTITPSALTLSSGSTSNYSITYTTGTLTVNAALITVTASAQSKAYGATAPTSGTLDTNFTVTGLASGDVVSGCTLSYSGSPAGNLATASVGSYTITPSALTLSSGSTSNYSITYTNGTLTVNAAVLTITAANQTVAYGTAVATVTGAASYTTTGFVNGETSNVISGSATYTTTYTATTAAGAAGVTITPIVTSLSAANYSFTVANGTITVIAGSPAKLSITNISSQTAGTAFSVTVQLLDEGNNLALATSSIGVSLSAASPGTDVLSGTLTGTITTGNSSVTITGVTYTKAESVSILAEQSSGTPTITSGTSNTFSVSAATFTKFLIQDPTTLGDVGTQTINQAFSVRITASDDYGNTISSFTGTVSITSTGTLSAGSGTTGAFTAGVLDRSLTISNAGNWTITATRSSGGTQVGTSNTFEVGRNMYAINAASAAWNVGTTWSLTSGGATCNCVPTAADNVYIGEASTSRTLTIPDGVSAVCNSLFIGNNANTIVHSLTLNTINSSLSVSGNLQMNGPSGSCTRTLAVGAGNLNVEGNLLFNHASGAASNTNRLVQVTLSTGTVSIGGNVIYNAPAATVAGTQRIVFSAAGQLNIGGNIIIQTGTTNYASLTPSTGTVNFNGTNAITIPVGVSSVTYNNLKINNTNAAGATISAAITSTNVTGSITVGDVNTGSLFNTNNLGVTLGNSDALTVAANSTMNAGTTSIQFGTSGTATINGTFRTADPDGFSGSTTTAISSTNTPTITLGSASTVEYNSASAQNITARNYANLTSSNTGARTLPSSGTVGISGTFTPGSNTYTITGSTVDFNGSDSQTIPGFNYNNLTSSSTGARTLASGATIGIAGTFTPGSNSYTIATNTIDFNGSGPQTITAFNYNNLTSSSTGARTLPSSGTIGVAGIFTPGSNTYTTTGSTIDYNSSTTQNIAAFDYVNLTSSSTGNRLLPNSGTVRVSGTFSPGTNSYSAGNGTFEYNGTVGQTIAAINYNNLTSSSSGARTLASSGTVGVAGTFTPGSNSYTITGSTIDFNGTGAQSVPAFNYNNLTSSSSGARTLASSGTVGVAGTFTPGSNSYTITGSTIDFNGLGSQSIPAFNYNNLTSSSSGARTLASSGTVGVAGTFTPGSNSYTITGSTIDFNGTGAQSVPAFNYNNLTSSSSGGRTLASTGTIGVAGTFTPGSNVYTTTGSAIEYNGGSAQNVASFTYNSIIFSGAGTKTLPNSLTVQGNWTNNGTVSPGSSTVTFSGGSQSIGGANGTTFNNLTLAGSNTKTFGIATTIANALVINTGVVANLGTGLIHTAASITLPSSGPFTSSSYGGTSSPAVNISANFAETTGVVNVGPCNSYSLLTSTVTPTTCLGTPAIVSVTATVGNLPNGTYTVFYTLGSPNAGTGSASMSVTNGTGSFKTTSLANVGTTAITIDYLTKDCVSKLVANNTATTTTNNATTYNGIWTNGEPTESTAAIISANFTSPGTTTPYNLTACKLIVNNNATVRIKSGDSVTLDGALAVATGCSVTFDSGANLIQSGTTNENTGAIIIKRESAALKRLDYTIWSSPVAGQQLYAFSPITVSNRFYSYNSTSNVYEAVVPWNTTFSPFNSYLIRTPNNHPNTPTTWTGQFTGVPNNGNYNMAFTGYRLIGNPYPSAIDIETFIQTNVANGSITGTVYFWRKTNGSLNGAYCTQTLEGFTINNPAEVSSMASNPSLNTNVVQVGQGFFVEGTGQGNVVFTNEMRINSSVNRFFRTSNTVERNRIWLNITNTAGAFSQAMIGYITGATQGVDPAIDGKLLSDGDVSLASLIGTTPYAIQGRALPFDMTDVVPLSFKVTTAGDYTITIDRVDGLFSNGAQTVYLRDNTTGVVHNLSAGAYTFASASGTFNTRFEIIYQGSTLAVSTPTFNESQVVIYKTPRNEISINTGNVVMSKVKIFDIRGRLLQEQKDINASQTLMNAGLTTEVLLVQITSDEGVVVTKKVLFPRTSLKLDKKLDVKTQLAEDE